MLLSMRKLPLHAWLRLPSSLPPSICADLAPFVTMTTFALLNSYLHLATAHGVSQVGSVPSGLPLPSSPILASLSGHAKDVALLTFVMLIESMAIGKALAAKAGQTIHNRQEFVAVGVANMAGACFSSYTCAGSFSRSAVVVATGGHHGHRQPR
jgi:MFS superfamily sulfate permease-like transporter